MPASLNDPKKLELLKPIESGLELTIGELPIAVSVPVCVAPYGLASR
jgi:hypothetical protein